MAAHHGLVKMIPQWERGGRVPRERYRLLYLQTSRARSVAWRTAWRSAQISRCGSLRSARAQPACPALGEITALEGAALAKPRETMTRAEIRALAEEAIARLHEVTDKLTELSALLGDDQPGEGKP